MDKGQRGGLEKAFNAYFTEIHRIYTGRDFTEESFYPALKSLIEECYAIVPVQAGANVLVVPKKTEAGIPDFRIGRNGEIVGYIEAKPPG
jgi:hypothetical protein